jgi:hypothetical protein
MDTLRAWACLNRWDQRLAGLPDSTLAEVYWYYLFPLLDQSDSMSNVR